MFSSYSQYLLAPQDGEIVQKSTCVWHSNPIDASDEELCDKNSRHLCAGY